MRIKRIEQITNEKWLNLFAAEFEHNGHSGRWCYCSRQEQPVRRRRANAVILVPVLRAPRRRSRLVVLREFRVPVAGYIYAFPAGLLEEGESVEEAARREMIEETGLSVTRVKRISPLLFSSAGLSDEAVLMVFVDVETVDGQASSPETSEELEVLHLSLAGVRRLCKDPSALIDSRTWTALEMYRRLGRFD